EPAESGVANEEIAAAADQQPPGVGGDRLAHDLLECPFDVDLGEEVRGTADAEGRVGSDRGVLLENERLRGRGCGQGLEAQAGSPVWGALGARIAPCDALEWLDRTMSERCAPRPRIIGQYGQKLKGLPGCTPR